MRYSSETIPVCESCAPIENTEKQCLKCGVAYCVHYASSTDIRFCGNCMSDFKVTTSTEIRTTEAVNSEGEIVYQKRERCKRLHLEGTDWLFITNKISDLTDDDLDATIEYHREIANMMISERETRRVEKFQKLSKIVVNFPPRTNVDATGAVKGTLKKKVSTKIDNADKVADAMTLLLKNFSPEQLKIILASKGKK